MASLWIVEKLNVESHLNEFKCKAIDAHKSILDQYLNRNPSQ